MANGVLCLGPGLLTTAAWILSVFVTISCRFFSTNESSSEYGLWSREQPRFEEQCVLYFDPGSFGATFKAARAFAIVAASVGFCAMVLLLFAFCLPFLRTCFKGLSLSLLLNTLFQGLTFLVWRADICTKDGTICSLSKAGRCSIAATCLYFVSALLCCISGKSNNDSDGEPAQNERAEPQSEHSPTKNDGEEP